MAEYIEREAAKNLACEICQECDGAVDVCEFRDIKVDSIPAADVRPVVLCGECKHYEPLDMFRNSTDWNGMCHYWNCHATREDGFCFKAAKKEES